MVTDQGRKRFYMCHHFDGKYVEDPPKEKGGTLASDGTECL